MDKFKIIRELGEGTFGTVYYAQNLQTGESVALKKMK